MLIFNYKIFKFQAIEDTEDALLMRNMSPKPIKIESAMTCMRKYKILKK